MRVWDTVFIALIDAMVGLRRPGIWTERADIVVIEG